MGYEDDRDWCYGWVPLPLDHPNCTRYKEFDYTTAGELKSIVTGTYFYDHNFRGVGTKEAKGQLPYQYFLIIVVNTPFCPTNILEF